MQNILHNIEETVSFTLPKMTPEGGRLTPQALAELLHFIERHCHENEERDQAIAEVIKEVKIEIATLYHEFREYKNWTKFTELINSITHRLSRVMSNNTVHQIIGTEEGVELQNAYNKVVTLTQSMNLFQSDMLANASDNNAPTSEDTNKDGNEGKEITAATTASTAITSQVSRHDGDNNVAEELTLPTAPPKPDQRRNIKTV